MPIMDVHRIFHGLISKIIRRSIGQTTTDASSDHPEGVSFVVVVPSIAALGVGSAPELSGSDHQSVFQ